MKIRKKVYGDGNVTVTKIFKNADEYDKVLSKEGIIKKGEYTDFLKIKLLWSLLFGKPE